MQWSRSKNALFDLLSEGFEEVKETDEIFFTCPMIRKDQPEEDRPIRAFGVIDHRLSTFYQGFSHGESEIIGVHALGVDLKADVEVIGVHETEALSLFDLRNSGCRQLQEFFGSLFQSLGSHGPPEKPEFKSIAPSPALKGIRARVPLSILKIMEEVLTSPPTVCLSQDPCVRSQKERSHQGNAENFMGIEGH